MSIQASLRDSQSRAGSHLLIFLVPVPPRRFRTPRRELRQCSLATTRWMVRRKETTFWGFFQVNKHRIGTILSSSVAPSQVLPSCLINWSLRQEPRKNEWVAWLFWATVFSSKPFADRWRGWRSWQALTPRGRLETLITLCLHVGVAGKTSQTNVLE